MTVRSFGTFSSVTDPVVPSQAASIPEELPVTIQADGGEITPRADVIVVKTRINNGVRQYRRWNETQNCWVDPDWIDF